MEIKKTYLGWTMIIGTIGFALIVVFLHMVQPNYDPIEQQMSELALGKFGSFMLLAFSSFALSVFALQKGLQQNQASVILRLLLIISTICLVGAGLFRLDNAAEVHIALVSIAFVLIVLVMYLLPRNVVTFNNYVHRIISWALGAGTAMFVALSVNILPMGIGQRGAVLCISIWLVWVGRRLIYQKKLDNI